MQRLNIEKVQRPRRTSEFREEPGTATNRQSKLQQRGTSSIESTPMHAGTAQKYSIRSSATRSTSRPRSVLPTPQQTPKQSARVLFTAEKQRGTSGVALHNDKKWIQDQTQRITEFLRKAWQPGCMTCITEDFFTRSNCLKQMTIKQFVAIINFFLQFLSGTRYAVGSNHIEDIVNILQKLKYPHQVNKSWLKTPNTTHSFGNVIVLFDFLMSIVPQTQLEFALEEPQEGATNGDEVEPDLEFKTQFLQNCHESFFLWDKQREEDFQKMKRQTADLLVQKRCCVAKSLEELDMELDRLLLMLEDVQKHCPHITPEDERECERLKKFLEIAQKEIQQMKEDYTKKQLHLEQILAIKRNGNAEFMRLEKEIDAHQTAIREQHCNVKQRDACVEKLKVLRLELQCHERTVVELQHRDYRQQVQLSVVKKNVTEKIENINTVSRDITFSLSITDPQHQYQIPLNADVESVDRFLPRLKSLHNKISSEIKKAKEEIKKYDTAIEKLNFEVSVSIEPRMKAQEATLTDFLKKQDQLEQHLTKDFEVLYARKKNVDLELRQLQLEIALQEKLLFDGQSTLKQIERECEELMSKAEKEHSAAAKKRRNFLNEYETNLNLCVNRLRELEQLVGSDSEKENKRPVLQE